jgi:hypothetical protein
MVCCADGWGWTEPPAGRDVATTVLIGTNVPLNVKLQFYEGYKKASYEDSKKHSDEYFPATSGCRQFINPLTGEYLPSTSGCNVNVNLVSREYFTQRLNAPNHDFSWP